jgi:hypothetical protein
MDENLTNGGELGSAVTQGPVAMVTASILSLACMAGCASSRPFTPGDVPKNTQLALSPNGSRLLVSWWDSEKKFHAKLVELNGKEVSSAREITLPSHTFTTAFGKGNDRLLVTTLDKSASELFKIDLKKDGAKDVATLIYKSPFMMRYPLEVSDGNYVFLEAQSLGDRYSHWKRFQNGEKTLLNSRPFSLAAPLTVIDEGLFLLVPSTPPSFFSLQGTVPAALNGMVDSSTFQIECADRNPLACVRTNIHFDPTYSTMEILNGQQRCNIDGRWIDYRELYISRDGSTLVFHAALTELDGPRAIYIVKNINLNCSANAISVMGNK